MVSGQANKKLLKQIADLKKQYRIPREFDREFHDYVQQLSQDKGGRLDWDELKAAAEQFREIYMN